MTNFLRYPGGKSKSKKYILPHFPKQYDEYREPMIGGGSIYFSIDTNVTRWINDINDNLISVYLALKDRYEEFIKLCRSIDKDNLESEFSRIANDSTCDKALRYFFLNRTIWGGRVNYNTPSRLSLTNFSNPSGWNIINSDKLLKVHNILQNTKITSLSYEELLFADGGDCFCYIDPPYVLNDSLSKTSQLYQHNFTEEDHYKLYDNLKQCKHKWCLSYDNHPLINKLYKDYNIINLEWSYVGTASHSNHSKTKRVGQELLITNY